ncbi:MAG: hypothetical protein K2O00_02315 [Muribaculaceae bacterium]|nr:hypothetical protein [Muribaculaceae bacterium]
MDTLHALGRLRAGKGFGVHSPFAYAFIKDVLRLPDKYGYYAYHLIDSLYATAVDSHSPVLPVKYLKLIYRIVVFYNSGNLRVIGDPQPLNPFLSAVKPPEELPASGRQIIIVAPTPQLTEIDSIDFEQEPIFIVTCLKQNRAAWEMITSRYTAHGMSFANPHFAVFVPDSRLPRQHFNLWI